MRIIPFILALLFALNSKGKNQDSLVNRIFNLAYNMEYAQAEKLLENNKASIDAFHYAVLEIDMSYWKNVTGTDQPDYLAFEKTLEKYEIDHAQSFQKKGLKLIQQSYMLRYQLKRLKLFGAISTHQKTKTLYEEMLLASKMEEMENPDLFRLYNSMFIYFSNYLKILGGKAKKENCRQALSSMRQLAKSEDQVTHTLATYFLGRTYLKYENDPEKGIDYFQLLSKAYPGNKKFPELLSECKDKVN